MKQRAVSPILATLLLMGVTVSAIGLLSSTVGQNMEKVQKDLTIETLDMSLSILETNGKAYLIFDIKNTGSMLVENAKIWFIDDLDATIEFNQPDLYPGVHWSHQEAIDATLSNKQYNISIEATGVDGSEFADIVVVIAS